MSDERRTDDSQLPDFRGVEGPDLFAILEAFDPMRETCRGVVAMFVSDGFSDEQARALAVVTLTGYRFNKTDDEGEV